VNITQATAAAFGDLPPVSHLLRRAILDRWLRVHSLPQSKRYAETDVEYEELIRRHNAESLVELVFGARSGRSTTGCTGACELFPVGGVSFLHASAHVIIAASHILPLSRTRSITHTLPVSVILGTASALRCTGQGRDGTAKTSDERLPARGLGPRISNYNSRTAASSTRTCT
jgi:hypothetical protein